jgi:hypothetical protein
VQQTEQALPDHPDHLVGAGEERWWDGEADCLGSFKIHHEFEPSRLLDQQIVGSYRFWNAASIGTPS